MGLQLTLYSEVWLYLKQTIRNSNCRVAEARSGTLQPETITGCTELSLQLPHVPAEESVAANLIQLERLSEHCSCGDILNNMFGTGLFAEFKTKV